MKNLFSVFKRSVRQPAAIKTRFLAAFSVVVLVLSMLFQLILPALKVEAADPTIHLVRSQPSIECVAVIANDAKYAETGADYYAYNFSQAVGRPSGSNASAYLATLDKVQQHDPMVYIYFTGKNSSGDVACSQAGMLFQSTPPGTKTDFYGFVYDDADGGRRGPISVAAVGTVNRAAKTLSFTASAYPSAPINQASYSVNVDDHDTGLFSKPEFWPAAPGGGGNTNTGPCQIFTLPGTISACQGNLGPSFVDIATISYRGESYTTHHWGGSEIKYYLSGSFEPARKANNIDKGISCRPYFTISADKSNGEGLDINLDDSSLNQLNDIEKTIAAAEAKGSVAAAYTDFDFSCAKTADNQSQKVTSVNNARIWGGYYAATNTINLLFTDAESTESPYLSVYKTTDHKTFAGTNMAGCEQSAPHMDFGQPLNALTAGTTTVSGDWYLNTSNPCESYAKIGVRIRVEPSTAQPPVIQSDAAASPDAAVHVDCEWSINPLTWIMCPLLDAAQGIVNAAGTFIKDQLDIDAGTYFDKNNADAGKAIYQAWNSVRLIAMSLLVVIALIMVIAQAMSLEIFDAYTVKKVLPKLAIAIIGISLSWEVMRLLIIASNDLAKAVQSIILTPFDSLGNPTLNGAQITTLGVGTAAVALVGIAFLLSIFAAAALALMLAFVAIILRQMAVIFLVIVAPIAILASILPNTQKLWKIWHETFSGALLVYSIIVGFIALGAAFGRVADSTNTVASPYIALIATYIPYFLIPKAFSMATGLIGTLGGMVNDRGRGAFDRLRKIRQAQPAKQLARARAGKYFRGANQATRFGRFRSRLNTGFQAAGHANRAGFNPVKWSSRIGGALTDASIGGRDAMREDKDYTWKNDDDMNRAALRSVMGGISMEQALRETGSYDENTVEGRKNLRQDASRMENIRKKYGDSAFSQATWMQAVSGGTAYRGVDMWRDAARLAGGNRGVFTDLIGQGKGIAMNAGRADEGGAAFGDTMSIATRTREGWDGTDAQGNVVDRAYTAEEYNAEGPNGEQSMAQRHLSQAVLRAQGAQVLLHPSMKQQSVDNLIPAMQESVVDSLATGNADTVTDNLAQMAGVYENINATNPQKAEALRQGLTGQTFDLDDLSPALQTLLDSGAETVMVTGSDGAIQPRRRITLAKAMETVRGSDRWIQSRREFQSRADAQNAQVQNARGGNPTGGIPPVSTSAPTGI